MFYVYFSLNRFLLYIKYKHFLTKIKMMKIKTAKKFEFIFEILKDLLFYINKFSLKK